MAPILFLKARLPGGADLFTESVQVGGYTTADGTYVAPHTAIRHKKAGTLVTPVVTPVRRADQGELFAPPAARAPAPKARPAPEGQSDMFATPPPVPAAAPAPAPAPKPADPEADATATMRDKVAGLSVTELRGLLDRAREKDVPYRAVLVIERALIDAVRADPVEGEDTVNDFGVYADAPVGAAIEDKKVRGTVRVARTRWGYVGASSVQLYGGSSGGQGSAPNIRGPFHPTAEAATVAVLKDVRTWAGGERDATKAGAAAIDRLRRWVADELAKHGAGAVSPESKPRPRPAKAPAKDAAAFGVAPGTSKKRRREMNAAAVALLEAKGDADMTADDKAVLAQYSGRGGSGDSLNEYYTPPALAKAVWDVLGRAGFEGGRVLEPSAGTGVFLHTAPDGATVQAVELDPTSSRICRILHGDGGHGVENSALEAFATGDGTLYDAVIGNPPFGPRGSLLHDDKPEIARAEAYFLDTALDKVKDGGLVAFVLPSGVMDSANGRGFREDVLRKAEFLGGSRLPNSAFAASHTDVTCDVLVFRKRPQVVAGALSTLDQDQLRAAGVWDADWLAGTYFRGGRGEGNVHGSHGTAMRAWGEVYSVDGSMVGVPDAVAQAPLHEPPPGPDMHAILAVLGDDEEAKRRATSAGLKPAYQVAKPGDIRVVRGVRYILQGDPPRWHLADDNLHEAVESALKVAEHLHELHEGAAADPAFARVKLVEGLDEWVRTHGSPARNKHLRSWLAAPFMPLADGSTPEKHGPRVHEARRRVARLLGAVGDDGSYSDLVTGVRREGDAVSLDTVATQLSLESGGFGVDQVAAATGRSPDDVLDHLVASSAYAVAPDGRTWSTLDAYASGDLWPKLDAVTAAAAAPGADPVLARKWTAQAALLEAAIAPQSLEDVEITFGSGFIKPEIITGWFQAKHDAWRAENPHSRYPGPDTPVFAYSADDALWTVKGTMYGDAKLILTSLNRTGVRKDDVPKLTRLNQEFAAWVRESDHRDAVEEQYNRSYRGFVAPAYAETPLEVPGLNPAWKVNAFHWSGLRWALEAGKGIVAADVGLGKTIRGLMLGKLLQATGRARKPVFVVPKSVMANWLQSVEDWFPGSRVLTIGETYSRDKLGNVVSQADDADTRRKKYHQLGQNDYDFVLISQPAWNDLDVSPERRRDYEAQDFWAKRTKALQGAADKKVAKARVAHDQEMAGRKFARQEGTIYFDDLGIDAAVFDEGHHFKNLFSAKNRFGESPKFLGGSGQSKRAQDTFFKSKAIREANGGKGVFMLTATPTKNSPLEVYSMLAHVAPEAFERMGIHNSEEFIDRFCEFEEDTILNPGGELEQALVTAGFKNLGELREVMGRYIDRKTAEDVGLVIPRGQAVEHYVDMTAAQESAYQDLRPRFTQAEGDATGDSHIFSIMSDMGKASIDLSLVDPSVGEAHMPKVDACVATAMAHAHEGGQIIFCDSKPVHEKIVAKLVANGVPRSEIAIINADATPSSAARQRVCDQFNAGRIRYVVGNTATMGEGVNLQKGTSDIHHLDLPWEPASMQQRNGRGVRQGNTKVAVRLHSYLAKRSFDGYRLQTINAKKDWQALLWFGGDRVENLARHARPGRDELLVMMAADPEAAAAKLASDKEAALARRTAEERGRANDAFGRYNKMRRALVKLKGEPDPKKRQEAGIVRLERKAVALREQLRDMKGFAHHDMLDSDEPVLIEPVTGHAWHKGAGLVLAGGDKGPLNYSDADTRWVVTDTNPDTGHVVARPYGTINGMSQLMSLDRMKEGVTPFAASDADERKLLDAEAAAAMEAKLAGGDMHLHDLRNLPAHVLAERQPAVQAAMKASVRGYKDARRAAYGLLDANGTAIVKDPWETSRSLDTHDLLLPVPEHREKALDAYVREAMSRELRTEADPGAGRNRFGSEPKTSVRAQYPSSSHGNRGINTWAHVLTDVFGPEAATEGRERLHRTVIGHVKAATTMREAVRLAGFGADAPGYGGWGTAAHRTWPPALARALADKARALGVLDKPLPEQVKVDRHAWRPDLHGVLLQDKGVDYSDTSYGRQPRTVRDWLAAIAHPDDAAAVKE